MSRFAAGKNGKPGKKGGPVLLPDYTPLTKAQRAEAEKFNATCEEHNLEPIEIRGPVVGGRSARLVQRRKRRKLTSLDIASYQKAQARAPKNVPVAASTGKRIQKYQRAVVKAMQTARMTVGLLIRATGQHAELVAKGPTGCAYKLRIDERGTSISPLEGTRRQAQPEATGGQECRPLACISSSRNTCSSG